MTKLVKMTLAMFLIIVLAGASGCVRDEADKESILTVAAAANFQQVFQEIGASFTEETGIPVQFNFASTGLLAQQIDNGAPVDLFASANVAFVDNLAARGRVIPDSQEIFARGTIALIANKEFLVNSNWQEEFGRGDWELLLHNDIRNVAIANPQHAPYGAAAREFLQTVGIWEELEDKLVYGANVRDSLNLVLSGNAEVGIAALSIVIQEEADYKLIPEELHEPLNHSIAVVAGTELEEEASKFTQYVLSEEGRDILEKYGFAIPDQE